jgi:hypothetical protein
MGVKSSCKTTLSYYLSGIPLEVFMNVGNKAFKVNPSNLHHNAEINNTRSNAFKIPNECPCNDYSIVDCSSFQDSISLAIGAQSYYFLQYIFERLDRVKFVLTVSMAGFRDAKMEEYTRLLERFLSMFQFTNKFTMEDLMKSVCLVLTAYDPNKLTMENIEGRLKHITK